MKPRNYLDIQFYVPVMTSIMATIDPTCNRQVMTVFKTGVVFTGKYQFFPVFTWFLPLSGKNRFFPGKCQPPIRANNAHLF